MNWCYKAGSVFLKTCIFFPLYNQRPPFLPPPMGNMPPPPGMIFPPGMHPVPTAGGAGGTSTEEIWVENTTPEGKVLIQMSFLKIVLSFYITFVVNLLIIQLLL